MADPVLPDDLDTATSTTPLAHLLSAAAGGDQHAWDALVDRYAGLVVAVARRYRLGEADLADVSQTVWLRLVENLRSLRDPDALPGWLVTTTRNECVRVLRSAGRLVPVDEIDGKPMGREVADDDVAEGLLRAERQDAVRAALWSLPARCRDLFRLLLSDPPLGYDVIGKRLGMPHGSIGPTRGRCLDRLRAHPAVAALIAGPDETLGAPAGPVTRGGGHVVAAPA
jgi:RNA polymerase sigma factor (sigma-70 family)